MSFGRFDDMFLHKVVSKLFGRITVIERNYNHKYNEYENVRQLTNNEYCPEHAQALINANNKSHISKTKQSALIYFPLLEGKLNKRKFLQLLQ